MELYKYFKILLTKIKETYFIFNIFANNERLLYLFIIISLFYSSICIRQHLQVAITVTLKGEYLDGRLIDKYINLMSDNKLNQYLYIYPIYIFPLIKYLHNFFYYHISL